MFFFSYYNLSEKELRILEVIEEELFELGFSIDQFTRYIYIYIFIPLLVK